MLQIQTQLVKFTLDCAPANQTTITNPSGDTLVATTSLGSSCVANFTGFVGDEFDSWTAVAITADMSCIPAINSSAPKVTDDDEGLKPIAFGFFANRTLSSGAFCYSYQEVYNATVEYDIKEEKLASISNLQYVPSDLEGFSQNGCVFSC